MPGPAPKHPSTVARRNKPSAGFRQLPAAGRKGRTPAWPLPDDYATIAELKLARARLLKWSTEAVDGQTAQARAKARTARDLAESQIYRLETELDLFAAAEVALWRSLWRTPQAVLWVDAHALREVAQYVRWKVRAEQCDPKAAIEARLLGDRLGMTPLALARLRCEIEAADVAVDRSQKRRSAAMPPPPAAGEEPDDPRAHLKAV